ncbi:MAG: hypothetical protein AAFU85_33930 [Planctomycetota bacterium]
MTTRRAWEAVEDEFLRRYYRSDEIGIDTIECDLERSRSSIYQRAKYLGLVQARKCASDAQIIGAIQLRHPEGWSDNEIAAELGARLGCAVNRHRVGRIRQELGLPTNRNSEHSRKRVAAKTREQLLAAGEPSLGQLRVSRFNAWKQSLGWPTSLTVRAVQALELFYQHGVMTRLQLCSLMGIDEETARRVRTEPKSNAKGGTVLAELKRASLVTRLPKQVRRGRDRRGGWKTVDLYLLKSGVEPNHEQRQSRASTE